MKNSIQLLLLTICLALGAGTADAKKTEWGNLKRYASSDSALRVDGIPSDAVVFIGNSITDHWYKKHPEFFTDNNFIGRGISGQVTAQFLVRFRNDVVSYSPAAVVINGGINDIAENQYEYNEDLTFGNIVSMAEIANANGITVIITSVLPASHIPWNQEITEVPDKVTSLNGRLEEYAREHGYAYIDYYTPMVFGDNRALNPDYTYDGVHPTLEGYAVMEQLAIPVIKEALARKK